MFGANSVVLAEQLQGSAQVGWSGLEIDILFDWVDRSKTVGNQHGPVFRIEEPFQVLNEKLDELGVCLHACCRVTAKDECEVRDFCIGDPKIQSSSAI